MSERVPAAPTLTEIYDEYRSRVRAFLNELDADPTLKGIGVCVQLTVFDDRGHELHRLFQRNQAGAKGNHHDEG